jgi:hypothetical protein
MLLCPALMLFPERAEACSVPVFRYALERWEPDSYHALVFHKGRLTDDDRGTVDGLHLAGKTPTNIRVTAVDLDEDIDKELKTIYDGLGEVKLPYVTLVTPFDQGPPRIVCRGELRDAAAREEFARVIDSPSRRKIVERILGGDTAVWIFLETGDKEADDKTFAILESALRKLEKELELPEQEKDDIAEALIDPDSTIRFEKLELKIAFSTLRVSRKDAKEAAFVKQLLATEEDLVAEGLKPMVFPVFGRGRALWAYVGDGITEENLSDAATFLVGPCSCQVKRQNPGVDLILAADWEGSLTSFVSESDVVLPPLAGLDNFVGTDDTEATEATEATEDDEGGTKTLTDTAVNVLIPTGARTEDPPNPGTGTTAPSGREQPLTPAATDAASGATLTETVVQTIPPPSSGVQVRGVQEPETAATETAATETLPHVKMVHPPSSLTRNLLLLGAVGLLLVIGASLLVRRKKS